MQKLKHDEIQVLLKSRCLTKTYKSFAKIQNFNKEVQRFSLNVKFSQVVQKFSQKNIKVLLKGKGLVKKQKSCFEK